MNEQTADGANGRSTPRQIADLRKMSLSELAADRDGVIAALRDQVLDGQEGLRVAAFQSSL